MSAGDLAGKVALISGTTGGMGRAAALEFAAQGARVVGCDLDQQHAAETVELMTAAGGTMTSVAPVDLATEDGTAAWIEPWDEPTFEQWRFGILLRARHRTSGPSRSVPG